MARLRSSAMGAAMRILAIGVCVIGLAAGHADAAFQGKPPPRGQFAPRGRDGQPPLQQPSPQGQQPPSTQPSPQGGPAAGQSVTPDRSAGGDQLPGRGSPQNGGGRRGGRGRGRDGSGGQSSRQISSSQTQGTGSTGNASVAGSAANARGGSRHDSSNGGSGGQTASSGSSRGGSGKSKSSPSAGGSQGASSKSSTSNSSSASPATSPSSTVAAKVAPSTASVVPAGKTSTGAVQKARRAGGLGRPAAGATKRPRRSTSARAGRGVAGYAVAQGILPTAFKQIAPRADRTAPARPAVKKSSNPLAKLGGQIPLPIPVPDWSKPIIIALLAAGRLVRCALSPCRASRPPARAPARGAAARRRRDAGRARAGGARRCSAGWPYPSPTGRRRGRRPAATSTTCSRPSRGRSR